MIRVSYITIAVLLALAPNAFAQGKKVWASGAARSVFQQNTIASEGDTVTPQKLNGGHALVDIAFNAKPNSKTFVHGMVRVRNDFGGFWGSGITFDMRQLYLKGLVRDAIRYQLGDINYKLTPYTFYNNLEELSTHQSEALNIYRELVRYDLFYTDDNTWRQQGAAVDFGLLFPKLVKELEVNTFVFRNRPTDFGQQSDRIFFGGNGTLVQNNNLVFGVNYIDLMDIKGTSRSNMALHNPVVTGTVNAKTKVKSINLEFKSESGISELYVLNDPDAAELRDYFFDLDLSISKDKKLPSLTVNYLNVGPQFRSIGAQSKRINFDALNLLYPRYGNAQMVRPLTQLDMMQDASLYQIDFSPELQAFAPQYDNVQPYGKATPNRQGFAIELDYTSPNKLIDIEASYQGLSEIVGQGVEDLRSFSTINVNGKFRIDTLIPTFKRALELSYGLITRNTTRSTAIAEGNLDLTSTLADIGIKIGVATDFDLLANYRMINASGNELIGARNTYTEIVDFDPFQTEMQQSILMLALRYTFDDENHLNIVWQKLNYEDSASENPSFDLSQFGIVYSMKF
ncbi:MAG: hypothetical protein JJ975_12940 [Bacteroidia bacterium]|nr:hypothetical protein [Bacteroidia bacterium]